MCGGSWRVGGRTRGPRLSWRRQAVDLWRESSGRASRRVPRAPKEQPSPESLRHPNRRSEAPLESRSARRSARVSPTGKASERARPAPANLSGSATEGEYGRRAAGPTRTRGARRSEVSTMSDRARRAPRHVRRPPHRSERARAGRRCSPTLGYDVARRARRRRGARRDPRARAARAGRRACRRPRRSRALRELGDAQRGVHVADRARLPRHDHAARDPAQRAREPGLVHRVHAVPARDQRRAGSRRCSTSRRW